MAVPVIDDPVIDEPKIEDLDSSMNPIITHRSTFIDESDHHPSINIHR